MDEFRKDESMVVTPTTVRERIDSALEKLAHFGSREDKAESRQDIIAELCKDLSEYYGYIEELTEFLLDLFSPAECVEYMDASDRPRPLVIRANTLKTNRKDLMELLVKRGAVVEAIDWSKVAIKVTESSVPIGATPEYLGGYYMLQSAASLNPVMALAPLPGEKVLDMSAAPGGKTTYIAQLMKNSGTLIANDLKPSRQKATVANLHRLGVKNATVCCYDGRKIGQVFKGFDRVMLDAPCSGLGVISRDQSVKIQRTVKDIQRISHLQKELLRAAVDAVDCKSPTGGIIVYSTCSISSEENEQVVDYILKKRFVKLVSTGLDVGKPGFTRHMDKRFHPSLNLTRRFYPHVHNMDGFYVAKFKKFADGEREEDEEETEERQKQQKKKVRATISDYTEEGSDDDNSDEDENVDSGDFEIQDIDDNVVSAKQKKAEITLKRKAESAAAAPAGDAKKGAAKQEKKVEETKVEEKKEVKSKDKKTEKKVEEVKKVEKVTKKEAAVEKKPEKKVEEKKAAPPAAATPKEKRAEKIVEEKPKEKAKDNKTPKKEETKAASSSAKKAPAAAASAKKPKAPSFIDEKDDDDDDDDDEDDEAGFAAENAYRAAASRQQAGRSPAGRRDAPPPEEDEDTSPGPGRGWDSSSRKKKRMSIGQLREQGKARRLSGAGA